MLVIRYLLESVQGPYYADHHQNTLRPIPRQQNLCQTYGSAAFLFVYFKDVIERYRQRTGHYPQRVLADKIYRNRKNLAFCKSHAIRLSGPALGRPKKDAVPDKKQEYVDICDRVEVERKITLAKRKCGLGLTTTRLKTTTASVIALSIVVLNLRRIQCALFQIFAVFFFAIQKYRNFRILGVVQ